MAAQTQMTAKQSGKLRIGDDWHAITIIALSQSNPLKAVAEFVENSIDAGAREITITRGREHGEHYLLITDDGAGISKDGDGRPDCRFVATHICDSMKRRLKAEGVQGIQGEFGIGLLSFWTVGEVLTLTSGGTDGKTYEMQMRKGDPSYLVQQRRSLFPEHGTRLKVAPLLPGIRQFSGEKIQWYLASELRDRIRQSGVAIHVVDRSARKEFKVEPRAFAGRLLHQLPMAESAYGEVYLELYLSDSEPGNRVGLYRSGTRILEDIAELEAFGHEPWSSGWLQGIVDAAFLNLTPATRTGVIRDVAFAALVEALQPVEARLIGIIEEQRRAEEEQASHQILRTIQKAFREALLALPAEEYDWFDIHVKGPGRSSTADETIGLAIAEADPERDQTDQAPAQKQFFDYAGSLHSVRIAPGSCVLPVTEARNFRAICRDRARHAVEEGLGYRWAIIEGGGDITNGEGEIITYSAPSEPGLIRLGVNVTQRDIVCEAEALVTVTVTDSLLPEIKEPVVAKHGLPGYTFERAPGQLWRSRFDREKNVIVINNGHRDFVYASRTRALKLRYISRLFAKELVLGNFPGLAVEQLLERLIELTLYTEENLK
ncbi:MAG: ATP-binding protein [Gammaproteobacteria bacterium]